MQRADIDLHVYSNSKYFWDAEIPKVFITETVA